MRGAERGDQNTNERWFATPHGDRWCFGHTTRDATEHGWMLCVAEGRGIVGGRGYVADGQGIGGRVDDTHFGTRRVNSAGHRDVSIDVRVIAMLAIGACAAAPVLPPKNAAAKAGPPPLFAKLFQPGATWTFPAETISNHFDGGTIPVVDKGEVTCSVENVHAIANGWVADLGCDGMVYAELSRGTYVATAAGLWQVEPGFEGDVTKLDPDKMLIGAIPHADQRTTEFHDEANSSETYKVVAHGGGWCFMHASAGGDEGGWMLCIAEGRGVIGGNGFFAGGATRDTYFGETPRY